MFKHFPSAACLMGAVAISFLNGCVFMPTPLETKEELVVMPDGSGKMTFTMTFISDPHELPKEKLAAALANQPKKYPPMPGFRGVVACTPVDFEAVADGCLRMSFTVYFEDLNQFQFETSYVKLWAMFWGNEPRHVQPAGPAHLPPFQNGLPLTFRYGKSGDGFHLEIAEVTIPPDLPPDLKAQLEEREFLFALLRYFGWPHEDKAVRKYIAGWKAIAVAPLDPNAPESKRAAKALAQDVLRGPRFLQSCMLPGQIKEAAGWTSTEGRTANLSLSLGPWPDSEAFEKLRDTLTQMHKAHRVRSITCGPSSLSGEAVAAFHKELKEAKDRSGARLKEEIARLERAWQEAKLRKAREAERRPFGLLQSAKLLLEADKLEAAKERLERIVADFPKSKAAPAAREVLDLLDKDEVEDAKTRLEETLDEYFKALEAPERREPLEKRSRRRTRLLRVSPGSPREA